MTRNTPNGNGQHEGMEHFVSEAALWEFNERQQAVQDTAGYYGLNHDNSLAISGGALAAHGIDAYVPLSDEEPFDLDILAVQDKRYRKGIHAVLRGLVVPGVEIYRDEMAPLNLTIFRGTKAEKYSKLLGYPTFENMVDSKVVVEGLATPPVDVLVREKLAAGRLKDYAGLVKAHFVANEFGHPVLSMPYWSPIVGEAMQKLTQAPAPEIRRLPRGLSELIENDFDHPAYHQIPRNR